MMKQHSLDVMMPSGMTNDVFACVTPKTMAQDDLALNFYKKYPSQASLDSVCSEKSFGSVDQCFRNRMNGRYRRCSTSGRLRSVLFGVRGVSSSQAPKQEQNLLRRVIKTKGFKISRRLNTVTNLANKMNRDEMGLMVAMQSLSIERKSRSHAQPLM
ncbi:hypothetical protein MP638_005067 [Amoeboaphelidium occidentale]|nr:hypothetical protein MP638_005067 [Amoeboaphelidium occidentale]